MRTTRGGAAVSPFERRFHQMTVPVVTSARMPMQGSSMSLLLETFGLRPRLSGAADLGSSEQRQKRWQIGKEGWAGSGRAP